MKIETICTDMNGNEHSISIEHDDMIYIYINHEDEPFICIESDDFLEWIETVLTTWFGATKTHIQKREN